MMRPTGNVDDVRALGEQRQPTRIDGSARFARQVGGDGEPVGPTQDRIEGIGMHDLVGLVLVGSRTAADADHVHPEGAGQPREFAAYGAEAIHHERLAADVLRVRFDRQVPPEVIALQRLVVRQAPREREQPRHGRVRNGLGGGAGRVGQPYPAVEHGAETGIVDTGEAQVHPAQVGQCLDQIEEMPECTHAHEVGRTVCDLDFLPLCGGRDLGRRRRDAARSSCRSVRIWRRVRRGSPLPLRP